MKNFVFLLVFGFIGCSLAEPIQVPCTFSNTARGYTCRLPDVNLADQDYVIVGGNHLPGLTDASVVSFVSINNNFREFPVLSRFGNLRHIQVTGSLIERLEAGDIGSRNALQSLNLDNNLIFSFDNAVFAGVPNLADLTIRFNRIRNVFPAVFSAAVGLQNLDLSYNLIERLSNSELFAGNARLESLQLGGNNMDYINPAIFNNLPALNLFDLSSNICYSGTFFGINQPQTRNQMLQRLQPCFSDGPVNVRCQFQQLEMNNNLGYGCVLRDIKLYDKSRQVEVGGFHTGSNTNADVLFVRIEISHTPFIIRELFTTFPNLEFLEIVSSDLEEIEYGSFANARNIRYINIRNNPIRRLEANIFQNSSSLEVLQFWWNRELNYISEYAFTGLTRLFTLQIIQSRLTYILPRTFRPIINLVNLDLSLNRLEYVDSRWFSTNRQLVNLNVNSNLISALHRSLLDLPNLSTLSLQGNRCVSNVFRIVDTVTRENAMNSLFPCFDAYPTRRRRFVLDVEGDVTFVNDNGNEIVTL